MLKNVSVAHNTSLMPQGASACGIDARRFKGNVAEVQNG